MKTCNNPFQGRIAISGASGFIGSHIRQRFPNHIVLNRGLDREAIAKRIRDADVVINLAGAPIIRRWTSSYKKVLIRSRIETTRKIVAAMNMAGSQALLLSASAIGIYPDNIKCDESCREIDRGFLGDLACRWEAAAMEYRGPAAILRFGVILGPDGGALKMMLPPFRLGLGGPIGTGRNIVSWMDIEDLVAAVGFLIRERATGIFNMVSPYPVTNMEFTRTLSQLLRRPAILPVPVLLLKLVLGQGAEVLTGSKEVYPGKLLKEGFQFNYPKIEDSLKHLIEKG